MKAIFIMGVGQLALAVIVLFMFMKGQFEMENFNYLKKETGVSISELSRDIKALNEIIKIQEIGSLSYVKDGEGNTSYLSYGYSLDTNVREILYLILDELDLKIEQTEKKTTKSKLILRSKTEEENHGNRMFSNKIETNPHQGAVDLTSLYTECNKCGNKNELTGSLEMIPPAAKCQFCGEILEWAIDLKE